MKNILLGTKKVEASAISLGCMRITEKDLTDTRKLIDTAMENGINFFDHADIYAQGEAESHFAKAIEMNSTIREKIVLQTKCGIRPGICFDFSKEHILNSVDESLKRLNTDYIDYLLLHRPDALMEPEEIAEAFDILEKQGKVKYFGVSNLNSFQIELLNKYCDNKIQVNQLQLSITNCPIIDTGINVNIEDSKYGYDVAGGILEYCRLKDITIQAWSPFQYGFFEGVFLGSDKYAELNKVIDTLAAKYNVENSAIAIAWILRHPANIQAVVGTTNAKRLADIAKAAQFELTREEWYELYLAAGKKLP